MNAAAISPTDTALASSTGTAHQRWDDPGEWDEFTHWRLGAEGQRIGESGLQISGIYCAACSVAIEQALSALPGVLAVQASSAAARAVVQWDPALTRPSQWLQALRDQGYDAVPDAAAPARQLRRAEARKLLWRLFVAGFCAMQVMMFASPSYFVEPGEIEPELLLLLHWGSWVLTLPVMAFSAAPFFTGAWRALRRRRIHMDVPVALGMAVTFIASTGATFDPGGVFGHEVFFDSLTMFVAFLLGGRWLEMRLRHRAAESFDAALARLPDTAMRQREDGSWEEVSLRRLRAGDILRVPRGAAFAADGTLLQGRTEADESLLTGESTPLAKTEGDEVIAGSVNVGAPVVMRALRVGSATRAQGIAAMARQAMTQRGAAAGLSESERFAAPFLWAVLATAAAAGLAWAWIDPSQVVRVVSAVLIVTCPCAFALAAPTTRIAAAGALARRGVVLQRLAALEPLAAARRLFIDKTGTLTLDQPRLSALTVLQVGEDEAELRQRAASLAQWSSHPLSRAVAQGAPNAAAFSWTDVQEQPGLGLSGTDAEGRRWSLGSVEFCGATEVAAVHPEARVWLARDGLPVAALQFEETLRADARQAVQALQARGWQISLLSGDSVGRVQALAEKLGLSHWQGAASPEDKLQSVRRAQAEGTPVVMVGDGINDAPVLAAADVSLAMGQGALLARAQADAVIVSERLQALLWAQQVAQKATLLSHQNLAWAALYNAACVPLALAGWLPPWAAGLGMALSSLAVIANAQRVASKVPGVDGADACEAAAPGAPKLLTEAC